MNMTSRLRWRICSAGFGATLMVGACSIIVRPPVITPEQLHPEWAASCRAIIDETRHRVITDAELALFAARVDALIIGADSVTSDLAVVNKVGSAAAAWGARSASRPCYVAVDTSKIAPRVSAAEIELEEKSGAEIWPERAEICSNVYFEAVPAKLITAYLTERGVLNHDGMAAEVARMARLHERRAGP